MKYIYVFLSLSVNQYTVTYPIADRMKCENEKLYRYSKNGWELYPNKYNYKRCERF